jgi:uncharacterized repeat protein (TIGR02543 family)
VKGAAVTLAANSGSLARTGYVFAGWNTAADGTGTSYAVSSSQTFAGNTTVYARWVAEYAITYELNGGVGDESESDGVFGGVVAGVVD